MFMGQVNIYDDPMELKEIRTQRLLREFPVQDVPANLTRILCNI